MRPSARSTSVATKMPCGPYCSGASPMAAPSGLMISGRSCAARRVFHHVPKSSRATWMGSMMVPVASPTHFITSVSLVAFGLNS